MTGSVSPASAVGLRAIIVDRTTMTTFYRLLGFLRPYRRALIASWVLASLAMVVTVAIPYLTGRAVDALQTGALHAQRHQLAARDHDRHTLLLLALVIVAAVLVRWVLTYFRRMIAGRVSLGIEYDLRELLYGHLQRLELGFFDHQQTGQLMSRATVDLQAVRFFLGYGLVFILQSALTLVLAGARDDRHQPHARSDRDGAGAVRRGHLPALRPPCAPRGPGGPAADRRADRERRGEHLRRARREVLRARAAPAAALPPQRLARVRPVDGRHAPGGQVQPDDRLPAPARPRRGAAARRSLGDPRPPHPRPVQRLLPAT